MSLLALNSIEKKINSTKEYVSELQKNINSEDKNIVNDIILNETIRRLEKLEEEKKLILESQCKELLSFKIEGEKVGYGKIPNRILASVLSGFQDFADNVASSITQTTKRGNKNIQYISSLTDFQINSIFAGSFGIVMEKNYDQLNMRNNSHITSQILDNIFTLLEKSNDPDQIVNEIAFFGKGTINSFKKWLTDIRSNEIDINATWIDTSAENRKLNICYQKINDTIFALENITSTEDEEIVAAGILTGINIRKNSFELQAESQGLIKGKSKIETLISITNRLGQEVNVNLIKSTVNSSTNIPKISWYLESLLDKK